MFDTRKEAQAEIKRLDELRIEYGMSPVPRRIIEKWGKFEIVVIESCQRCGNEVESRGATTLILCPDCWKKKEDEDARRADRAMEEAQARMDFYDDFEKVQQ